MNPLNIIPAAGLWPPGIPVHFIYSDFYTICACFARVFSHFKPFPQDGPRFPPPDGRLPARASQHDQLLRAFPTISQPSGRTKVVSSMRTPNFSRQVDARLDGHDHAGLYDVAAGGAVTGFSWISMPTAWAYSPWPKQPS